MTTVEAINQLTDRERRAILLALQYQLLRQQYGNYFFRVFLWGSVDRCGRLDPDLLRHKDVDKRNLDMFKGLLNWFEDNDFVIDVLDSEWKNYISYVFSKFYPQLPVPSQLMNFVLVKKFRSRVFVCAEPDRSTERLRKLYQDLLGEDIENANLLGV